MPYIGFLWFYYPLSDFVVLLYFLPHILECHFLGATSLLHCGINSLHHALPLCMVSTSQLTWLFQKKLLTFFPLNLFYCFMSWQKGMFFIYFLLLSIVLRTNVQISSIFSFAHHFIIIIFLNFNVFHSVSENLYYLILGFISTK